MYYFRELKLVGPSFWERKQQDSVLINYSLVGGALNAAMYTERSYVTDGAPYVRSCECQKELVRCLPRSAATHDSHTHFRVIIQETSWQIEMYTCRSDRDHCQMTS